MLRIPARRDFAERLGLRRKEKREKKFNHELTRIFANDSLPLRRQGTKEKGIAGRGEKIALAQHSRTQEQFYRRDRRGRREKTKQPRHAGTSLRSAAEQVKGGRRHEARGRRLNLGHEKAQKARKGKSRRAGTGAGSRICTD